MPNAVIAHDPTGVFDLEALKARGRRPARRWTGSTSCRWSPSAQRYRLGRDAPGSSARATAAQDEPQHHVVAIDYGVKRNILRLLAEAGCKVTVVPATASAEEIMALEPDGVFLSNGPGDPAATGEYAVPVIRRAARRAKVPTFGICLGHQMLGLAVGGRTVKMHQGHHGANHPVKDKTTGKVEIISMNHGFAVDPASLPATAVETHVSLFDGSNCGIALTDRPAFSVQYHPEASPGPRDSHYLFDRFVALIEDEKSKSEDSEASGQAPLRKPELPEGRSRVIAFGNKNTCAICRTAGHR